MLKEGEPFWREKSSNEESENRYFYLNSFNPWDRNYGADYVLPLAELTDKKF